MCAVYHDWDRLGQKKIFSLIMLNKRLTKVSKAVLFVFFSGEERLYSGIFPMYLFYKQALYVTCKEY